MTALASATRPNFDVEAIRADFPILHQQINGHDLVFLGYCRKRAEAAPGDPGDG